MASIERTAYPRFPRLLTTLDLQRLFSPAPEELEWVNGFARQADRRLALMAHADARRVAREVSRVVNTRVDIINILIGELVRLNYELPTFGPLVRIAEKEHESAAEQELCAGIEHRAT